MLTAAETSAFALALIGTGVVLAAVMLANPPARANSALFRCCTQGLPAGVAASVSEAAWRRLVRMYYACAMGTLIALGVLIYWVLPANRASLLVITLLCLATVSGARFFIRRYLLRQALPA